MSRRLRDRLRRWGIAGVLCMSAGLACPAYAEEIPSDPILRIETGMHSATIRRIGVDQAGRWLLTASDDKTARLWDVQTGHLLHTYRPPIGAGDEGKLYAGALSPDGRWVAVGGWTKLGSDSGDTVYLFDRASSRLQQRLSGLPNVITYLAFSPDGAWLAAGLGGNNGIRLWRADQGVWATAGEDRDYGGQVYGLDFFAAGNTLRLAASSLDGDLRLYRVEPARAEGGLRRLARAPAPGGRQPYALRFSPDGRRLAVGYVDQARVDVLDAEDLRLDFTPDLAGVSGGNLGSVAWAGGREGAREENNRGLNLLAGGRWQPENGQLPLRVWPDAGRGRGQTWPAGQNTLMDLAPVRAGPLAGATAWAASDPAWGVLDAQGQTRLHLHPAIANFRDNWKGFQISADGRRVRFGYEQWGNSPALFDLAERRFLPADESSTLAAPRTTGLDIQGWKYTTTPTLAGQPLKLQQYEMSRSLAIAADARRFVLGTEWSLRLFDAQGQKQWQQPAPGVVWGVNLPAERPLVVAAYDDGTIRWHRLSDGQELLAFFPHADRKRWVLWTPSGYYAASPGGEDLIGWHVNRGKDQAADFYPASRFRDRFYRPDVVQKVLTTLDEGEALRLADAEAGRIKAVKKGIQDILPPTVTILSPAEGETVGGDSITLRYSVRTAKDAPMTGFALRINGQRLPDLRDIVVDKAEGGEQVHEVRVPLEGTENLISLTARNRHNESAASLLRVYRKVAAPAGAAPKPKLYVLAVGVGDYEKVRPRLKYPAKDAQDFAEVMKRQAGGLYREVEVKLLTDAKATKDEILDGLEWLQKQVTGRDMGMMFLAGHGVNDPTGIFYYLPVNTDPNRLKRTGLVYTDIKNTLSALAGKAVFFVDACHSGNVLGEGRRGNTDLTAVVNELASAENGVVVFSSSTGREYSLEYPSWENGAFTKALVEGLSGKAAEPKSGRVTHAMLDFYVSERVKELTKGQQHPVKQNPKGVPDFPLAVVK